MFAFLTHQSSFLTGVKLRTISIHFNIIEFNIVDVNSIKIELACQAISLGGNKFLAGVYLYMPEIDIYMVYNFEAKSQVHFIFHAKYIHSLDNFDYAPAA